MTGRRYDSSHTHSLAIFLTMGGSITSSARADMIVTEGVQPWEICGECHGLDGVSPVARFPSLAGQRPAYIVKQVRDFRDGRRANDGGQMAANASDIGEADIAKAAAYFSALLPPAPMSSDLRALYWVGDASAGITSCASCHDGAEAAPSLQSQHAGYLAKELDDLRSGARANDDGVMRAIASKLSDADIEALSDYLASQPSTNVRR